ncbi:hypothetical protein Salat_1682300 [Sesamum alatum]|uniref:Uncharacterized protein n=1 Tax=Sesamum alatum TaxID=300844 RepID=A0AAE1Y7P4_9LAMI|nr:hypothetical protein Salat_1682300 [Sesamum alatum]
MNARLAEIARNLRRRNSPAAGVPPPANVDVASPEVDPHSESSNRFPAPVEVAGGAPTEPSAISPQVSVPPLRSCLAVQKRRVVRSRLPGSKASHAKRRNASANISVVSKGRAPASQVNSRASKPSAARPKTRLRKRRTLNNLRIRSRRGGNRPVKISRPRAAGSLKWKGRSLVPIGRSLRAALYCVLWYESLKLNCLVFSGRLSFIWTPAYFDHFFQASAFGHNLALKCSMFRNDKADAEKKIHELEQSLESARTAENEALDAKAAADARVTALETRLSATIEESKKQVVDALEEGHTDGFSTGLLARKTEGITEGREIFLQSDEYKQSIASARLQGARDFLKSPVFKTAVDVQSAQFLNDGFDKCIAQVAHLQGFVEGSDQARLDSSLDGQRQPYPTEGAFEPAGEDEFAALITEIGYVP